MGWNLSEFLAQVLKRNVQNGGKFRTSVTISTWLNLVPPIYLFKPCENVLSLCCMYCIHLAYLKKDKKRYKLIWPLYFNILRIKIFSLCMPFKEKKSNFVKMIKINQNCQKIRNNCHTDGMQCCNEKKVHKYFWNFHTHDHTRWCFCKLYQIICRWRYTDITI